MARKVAEWPRWSRSRRARHEPHRIAFYLYDLASDSHALWNKGHEKPELRFLQDGDNDAGAKNRAGAGRFRCYFSGLGILGVTPVEEMR